MIPKIDNKFEKFDITLFRKEVNQTTGKRISMQKKLTQIEERQTYGYISKTYFKESYFVLSKKFYSSGKIKGKAISIINGHPIGKWYEFDEEGNLIKEINTDEGYEFGWQEVIAYCEKKEIELTKGYEKGGYQTEILKQEENGKKVWVISYLVSPVLICRETLDGITGELLNSEEFEFINH